jgi:glycosyltransferase involved in cell wall biosynthesis
MPSKMKIAYLMQAEEEIRTPPFNGPANHIRQVVYQLIQQGHQVRLLIRLEGKIWASDDMQNFRPIFIRGIDRGPLRWVEKIVRRIQSEFKLPYVAFFESLRFALACHQEFYSFDILLERMSWMTYGGAMAARWLRIPLVLEYNGDPLDDLSAKGMQPKGFQSWISKQLMERNLKSASHIVASGEGWCESCMDTWGVEAGRITTIENGTELVHLLQRGQLRNFQDNEKDSTHLVYLGGFYPWHGVPVLLRAFAEVLKDGINAHLILIGSGTGEAEARHIVAELGLEDNVQFTGQLPVEEYGEILANSDIGLSPYCGWKEFSGLKLLDYKAAGLATIASGKDGQPVTLRHGVTGLIVPPCDEKALAEAVRSLCLDLESRKQIGRQARREAETIHSWGYTVQRLEQVLNGALST